MVRLKSNEIISNYALGVVGQYLTIWSNPYGSQCVVLINRASTDVNGIDMSYTNAIDLLTLAARKGYKVHPASVKPKKGWVFVIRANGHQFGHTGIFIADSDGRVWNTVETNVDNNWDSLSVGGPARRKVRYINNNAVIDPAIGIIGWIVGYFEMGQDAPAESQINKKRFNNMYGSFLFTVKEGDGRYGKGVMYFYNSSTNSIQGLSHPDEVTAIKDRYQKMFGENIDMITYSTSSPWYVRLFEGLGATFRQRGSDTAETLTLVKDIKKTVDSQSKKKTETNIETVTVIADGINVREGSSISTKIIGIVGKGSVLTVKNKVQADGATWLQIDYGTQLGYIMSVSPVGLVYAK